MVVPATSEMLLEALSSLKISSYLAGMLKPSVDDKLLVGALSVCSIVLVVGSVYCFTQQGHYDVITLPFLSCSFSPASNFLTLSRAVGRLSDD